MSALAFDWFGLATCILIGVLVGWAVWYDPRPLPRPAALADQAPHPKDTQ